jgi:hypothetical protein
LLVVPEFTGLHWPKTLMLEKSTKNVTVIELKIDIGSLGIVFEYAPQPLKRAAARLIASDNIGGVNSALPIRIKIADFCHRSSAQSRAASERLR